MTKRPTLPLVPLLAALALPLSLRAAETPYLVPTAPGVTASAVLSVGDAVGVKPDGVTPYRFCGIPDGLGAFDNGDGTFTLLMNHELTGDKGVMRAHGAKGAFVSKWTINKTTLAVSAISDLIQTVKLFDPLTGTWAPATTPYAFSRFCSADLPAPTAYFNVATGKGSTAHIFMNGEEISPEGTPPTGRFGLNFAHIVDGPEAGITYELPRFGKYAPENTLACPVAQDKTVVMGNSDNSNAGGFVYLYVGTKTTVGTEIDKAGLTNGTLFGVRANGQADETRAAAVGALKGAAVPFTLVPLGDVSAKTGEQLLADSTTAGATRFLRPEDGAWDPSHPDTYYFVTTDDMNSAKNGGLTVAGKTGRTRLWQLHFTDIANPENGGTITNLIDGTEDPGPQMMDNITVDHSGRIVICEDTGNNDHLGKVWLYDIATGSMTVVASHDPARFGEIDTTSGTPIARPASGTSAAGIPFTKDEETSGVLDVSEILGAGRFLIDVQAHVSGATVPSSAAELVEGGQLLAMTIPAGTATPVATGPDTAYLVPTASGIATSAILTVGQSVNLKPGSTAPYRFCGIPDGLGAFDNLDGTFTLLMNHELNSGSLGSVRAHGSNGAFVSRWTITKSSLAVTRIVDQIHTVMRFDPATSTYAPGAYQFQRFCSADLPAPTAYFNPFTGKGTSERIFMNGEEISPEGAPPTGRFGANFAHIATGPANGTSFELPRLGKYAPENTLANPFPQDKTVVMGNSDNSAAGGFIYLYVGTKTTTGTDIDKAGLTNGTLFGVRANGKADETRADAVGAAKNLAVPFTLVPLGDVSAKTGEQLFADSTSAGATRFLRPEDGAWDPSFPSDYYFVTTDDMNSAKNGGLTVAGKTGRSRLWKLHFTDIANPESGGTITNLISGAEDPGPQMMDNITVDRVGRIIIDEDPGNQDHLARIWSYDIHTGALVRIASHDPARFGDISTAGGTPVAVPAAGIAANGLPFSKDEESSGVLDVSDILGANRFLVDVQAHLASGTVLTNDQKELAEGGQLLAMTVALPNTPPVAQADTLTAVKDGKLVVAASALSANDTDADGDPVLVTAVSAASSQGGTVALVDGRVIYTPHAGFTGTDTFTYTLRDGARVSKPIPIDAPLASVPVTGGAVAVQHAGYGSAVAQAPGVANEYFLLTDRGPNVDGPTSGPLTGGKIFPVPAFHPEIARVRLNADGTVTRLATITLKDAAGVPLTGLPNPIGAGGTGELALDPALNVLPTDPTGIDSEGLVALADGSFWVSDEYGPWLLHLDGTGRTIERVGPFAANSAGHKLPSVLAKRLINKGMEGLTVTPDGSMLVGIMQSALLNGPSVTADTAKQVAMLRVVTYRLIAGGGEAVGATHQFAYLLEVTNAAGNKLASSELTALSNSEFLVNERDGKFPSDSGGANKKFWRFTLAGATDISGGDTADGLLLGGLPLEEALFNKNSAQARTILTGAGITALVKDATPLLDLVGTLGGQYAHDKVEGVIFSGGHIIISNDDDFGINGSGTVTAKTIPGSLPLGNLPGTATGPLTTDYSQLLEVDPAKLATATGTVTVTVAANSAPTIGTVADTTILEDAATGALAVTVGDAETPAVALVLTATSDNPALLPAGGIVLGGSDAARTITLTPAANQNGHALVTLTVTDAHGGTATSTFTLTVTPVNDAPVAADGTLAAVAGVPAHGTLVATDIDSATLTYAVVGAPATGTIVLDAGTGAYVYTAPAATPAGTVTFTFRANDGALNSNVATVTVTVAAAPPGEHHDDTKKKCGRGSGVMALMLGLFALIRLGLWRRRR